MHDIAGVRIGRDRRSVGAHERRGYRHSQERGTVDGDHRPDPAEADGQSTERRTDETGEAGTRRVGRVRHHELIGPHDAREQRDRGRIVDLGERRLGADDHVGRPYAGTGHRQQRHEGHGLGDVRDDDRAPEVPAVDQAAAERAEHERGAEFDDEQDRCRRTGPALDEDVHGEGDEQEPVADAVDEPAAPHEPEVASAPGRGSGRCGLCGGGTVGHWSGLGCRHVFGSDP